jgi:hypothetical protein
VETQRWVNRSHPQTLLMGTYLLYIDAFFGVVRLLLGGRSLLGLALAGGAAAAGYGIAQDRNWGWYLGIAVSAIGVLLNLGNLLGLLFAIAQIALLVHPMSRSYTKTWFR